MCSMPKREPQLNWGMAFDAIVHAPYHKGFASDGSQLSGSGHNHK